MARKSKQNGWAGIVATMLFGIVAFAQTPQKQEPKATQNQPAPKLSAPQTMLCPDGQPPRHQETPFGSIDVCPNGGSPAPAQAPAVPPATPPTTPSQATQPATAQPTPSTTAPATEKPSPTTEQKPADAAAADATKDQKPAAQPQNPVITPGADGAVSLNLENADLYQVLRILGSDLGLNYIVDPAVKGTVTINTSGTISRKDLFSLLQMILEINGAAAVKSNGYYAIVPLGAAKQQPLDFHYEKTGKAAPDQAFTLTVVPMKFMAAPDMAKLLTPFMSPAGQIIVQDKGNIMLILENAAKMAQLQEIVNIFDDPVVGRQRVRMFPVTNSLATNLVPELRSVFAGYGLSTGNTAIQFVPLERLNSILVVSPSPDVFDEVDSWIKKLDAKPTSEGGVRNFVYKVQNAKASDLRAIVTDLYNGTNTSSQNNQNGGTGSDMQTTNNTVTPSNPGAVMGPTGSGGGANAGGGLQAPLLPTATGATQPTTRPDVALRIMSDDRNNSLIVQATPQQYELVEKTLQELDVLPRQVMIDARIYEVDLTGDLSVGLSAFLDKKANQNTIATSGSFSTTTGLVAQTFAVLHNTYQLQLFLNASENRTRVKTLSAPSILVTDNTTARIQVGAEVPVPIGSSLTPVQSGGNSIFAQTIQFRDTGVILSVTPRINASGIVTLTMAQEVSTAQPNTTSAIVAPVISKSQFQTTAILKNGQTLALGGIITTSNNNQRNRIPLIGDIPGIGALFGNTSLNTTRKELVLMITPHVSEDMGEAGSISSELLNKMKSLKHDLKAGHDLPGGN